MKKFFSLLIVIFIFLFGYVLYDYYAKNKNYEKIDIEDEVVILDKYYIYGVHLNINGQFAIENTENSELVLYDGKSFSSIDYIYEDGIVSFSNYVNDGLYLDGLDVGKYYLFLRSSITEDDGTNSWKYYAIKNNTSYDTTTYYTFTDIGNKIIIDFDNDYETMAFTVGKNHDSNVYDIVIDAGHGGIDVGASGNGYSEIDFTVDYASSLVDKLTSLGYKTRLTWYSDEVSEDTKINEYGDGGRAVVPNEVHAKYLLSIHFNSGYKRVNGVEVYTASNINYDFAKDIVNNIVEYTGINTSPNKINKYYEGVYTRVFTEEDIASSIEEAEEDERNPYDITTSSIYYYIIRETGGIITGAYVDDRNDDIPINKYYNSNVGCESYLLELGYITNASDVDIIVNKKNEYIEAIATSFVQNMTRIKEEKAEIQEKE